MASNASQLVHAQEYVDNIVTSTWYDVRKKMFKDIWNITPLLDALQTIENRHGRIRTGERWGARTLDLDLLLYGDSLIQTRRLQVPHPRMGERAFVLVPLAEIVPGDLQIPGLGRLTDLLAKLSEDAVERLD